MLTPSEQQQALLLLFHETLEARTLGWTLLQPYPKQAADIGFEAFVVASLMAASSLRSNMLNWLHQHLPAEVLQHWRTGIQLFVTAKFQSEQPYQPYYFPPLWAGYQALQHHLDTLLTQSSRLVKAYFNTARRLRARSSEFAQEAALLSEQALKHHFDPTEAYRLADAYRYKLQAPRRAAHWYQCILQHTPNDVQLYRHLAIIHHEQLADYVQARAYYEQFLALLPHRQDARSRFADLLLSTLRDYEAATAHYEFLWQQEPDYLYYAFRLIRVYLLTDQLDAAHHVLQKVVKEYTQRTDVHPTIQRCLTLLKQGKTQTIAAELRGLE